MFCWHKWNKWTVKMQGSITDRNYKTNNPVAHGYTMLQERECSKCGKKQIKTDTEWY